eukprot:1203418-Rhodomonas_salina.3
MLRPWQYRPKCDELKNNLIPPPYILLPAPLTLRSHPQTLNLNPTTLYPQPSALNLNQNPQPQTLNALSSTLGAAYAHLRQGRFAVKLEGPIAVDPGHRVARNRLLAYIQSHITLTRGNAVPDYTRSECREWHSRGRGRFHVCAGHGVGGA